MTEVEGNVATGSHWLTWCRLCAKDDPRGNVKVGCKTKNKLNQNESTWENILVVAIKKYFEVNMCLEDELSSMLCTECYTLISELIDFGEHITKVQAIFQVLRHNDSHRKIDVARLRKQYGLRPGDWTHIIKSSENEVDCDDTFCGSSQEFVDLGVNAECEKVLENEAEGFVNIIVLKEAGIDGKDIEVPIKVSYGQLKSVDVINPIETTQSGSPCEIIENSKEQLFMGTNTESNHSTTNADVENVEDDANNSTDDAEMEFLPCTAGSPQSASVSELETLVDESVNSVIAKDDVSSSFSDMTCNKCGKSYWKNLDCNCGNQSEFQKLFIDKTTTCDICHKRLGSATSLRLHKEIMHANSKPFICDCCGKQLKTITALNEHKLVHTEDRPFVCPICNAGFKNKARLKIHNQIHEEPKYACNICGKKLQTRRTWNMHKLVHTEERKLKCDACGALFKRSKTLKMHLLSHTGLRPYLCNYCDKTFTCNANCRAHKLKQHPEEVAQEAGGRTQRRLNMPTLDELRIMTQKSAKAATYPNRSKNQ